jgi:hypothetical protein
MLSQVIEVGSVFMSREIGNGAKLEFSRDSEGGFDVLTEHICSSLDDAPEMFPQVP